MDVLTTPVLHAATLMAAWAEVEAVLPEGHEIYDLTRYGYDRDCGTEWRTDMWSASAGWPSEGSYWEQSRGYGSTATKALLDLAAILRGDAEDDEGGD